MNGSFFIKRYTEQGFDLSEAQSEIDLAVDILFNLTAKDFILGSELTEAQNEKLNTVITERLKTRRPLQQILGCSYFFGRKFFVNKYTLIPRPETELLIEQIMIFTQKIKHTKILDIGSGSGCIPITLALENKNITAHSVDISDEALEIAKKNAGLYKIEDRVKFFKSNLFENITESYNIIVSNPPYIPIKDKESLQKEVRDFEPELALFANDDKGIEFYQKIIKSAPQYLENNGWICFEIGINQCNTIKNLLKEKGFKNIQSLKDLNNIDRIVFAQK